MESTYAVVSRKRALTDNNAITKEERLSCRSNRATDPSHCLLWLSSLPEKHDYTVVSTFELILPSAKSVRLL